MKRRTLLGWLPRAVLASWVLAEGSLTTRPTLALGGESPPVGAAAPTFGLRGVAPAPGGQGEPIEIDFNLVDLAGRWVVLYFYPKDFTSGCTLEARGFQRDLPSYARLQADVVGISTDSPQTHGSFCGAEGLAYPLLSDPDGSVCRLYGSWLAPSALRHTFLIDPRGVIRARWLAVRPSGHSQEVLASLESLLDQEVLAEGKPEDRIALSGTAERGIR